MEGNACKIKAIFLFFKIFFKRKPNILPYNFSCFPSTHHKKEETTLLEIYYKNSQNSQKLEPNIPQVILSLDAHPRWLKE